MKKKEIGGKSVFIKSFETEAAKKEPYAKQSYERNIYLYGEINFEGYYLSVKPLS